MSKWYQQGDLMIVPVALLERNFVRGPKIAGNVLLVGEATGHAHVAHGTDVSAGLVPGDAEIHAWLDAPNGAEVLHEEHGTLKLPPGDYAVMRVPEYDHFAEEARNVRD